jgi:hypothetical protein
MRSTSIALAGRVEDFLSPNCKGSALWVPGSTCVVRAEETCGTTTTSREITISADGALSGTQAQKDGLCDLRSRLTGWSSSTGTTPAPATSGLLDVQLYSERGVPVGDDGGHLSYSRYRLRSNGTFASCAYELSFGPGVYAAGPEKKNQGTYEIAGEVLKLNNATGTTTSVPFKYAAGAASIDGKSYDEETPTSDSALCDFGV